VEAGSSNLPTPTNESFCLWAERLVSFFGTDSSPFDTMRAWIWLSCRT
jgi:hypothetical protein